MRTISRRAVTGAGLALAGCAAVPEGATVSPSKLLIWRKLPTEPFGGKQDDLVVLPSGAGWYGNGAGKVFRTVDAGESWAEVWSKPGTFVRALGFIDEHRGVLGNIGPGYFPGVTDPEPLYITDDGGATWRPAAIEGPRPTGICAIHVLREAIVNRGALDERVVVHAAGRVGGPAFFLTSLDHGRSWRSVDLGGQTAMIFDVVFLDTKVGFLCGASSAKVQEAKPLVLKTTDGGASWREVWRGARSFELTWKASFPTPRIGYVTIQSYDPDKAASKRYVLKTTDGGERWTELPVVDDHAWRPFGVGFADANTGWIGGTTTGMETRDGGRTWRAVEMGKAVNKIRVVGLATGPAAFAVGAEVHKLALPIR
jgi:photosystem II stability/assembly factor-like uncharacterized protein